MASATFICMSVYSYVCMQQRHEADPGEHIHMICTYIYIHMTNSLGCTALHAAAMNDQVCMYACM